MQTSNRRVVLAFFLWILLVALTAYVAWTLHATVVTLMSMWVSSPDYRPFGWTSESVQPFSRLSIVIIGSVALLYGLWLEHRLQRSARENKLWRFTLYTLIGLVVVQAVCLLLLRL